MFHVALERTPMRYRREFGTDHGADIFSHPTYIAALASIHSTNPKSAQLIWHRTLRHFIEDHTNAVAQVRANLQDQNIDSTKNFLTTNRYFSAPSAQIPNAGSTQDFNPCSIASGPAPPYDVQPAHGTPFGSIPPSVCSAHFTHKNHASPFSRCWHPFA